MPLPASVERLRASAAGAPPRDPRSSMGLTNARYSGMAPHLLTLSLSPHSLSLSLSLSLSIAFCSLSYTLERFLIRSRLTDLKES
jgi:hypothetical protein